MRIFLCLGLFAIACGDSTTGTDAGNDAGKDVVTTNDAESDVVTNDASNDASTDSSTGDATFGDGGLQQGAECDPQNNLCASTLLCCSEPTHNFDGGPLSHYVCEPPSNGNCPLLP